MDPENYIVILPALTQREKEYQLQKRSAMRNQARLQRHFIRLAEHRVTKHKELTAQEQRERDAALAAKREARYAAKQAKLAEEEAAKVALLTAYRATVDRTEAAS